MNDFRMTFFLSTLIKSFTTSLSCRLWSRELTTAWGSKGLIVDDAVDVVGSEDVPEDDDAVDWPSKSAELPESPPFSLESLDTTTMTTIMIRARTAANPVMYLHLLENHFLWNNTQSTVSLHITDKLIILKRMSSIL